MSKKPLFKKHKDGCYQWDIGSITFLIDDTNELGWYKALWVTGEDRLSYKMLERRVCSEKGENRIVRTLMQDARAYLVEKMVKGLEPFMKMADKKQKGFDDIMSEDERAYYLK